MMREANQARARMPRQCLFPTANWKRGIRPSARPVDGRWHRTGRHAPPHLGVAGRALPVQRRGRRRRAAREGRSRGEADRRRAPPAGWYVARPWRARRAQAEGRRRRREGAMPRWELAAEMAARMAASMGQTRGRCLPAHEPRLACAPLSAAGPRTRAAAQPAEPGVESLAVALGSVACCPRCRDGDSCGRAAPGVRSQGRSRPSGCDRSAGSHLSDRLLAAWAARVDARPRWRGRPGPSHASGGQL